MTLSRRKFITALGAAGLAAGRQSRIIAAPRPAFQLSVFSDEISQDLGRALEVASKEFGLRYVELRGMWNRNLLYLDEKELREVERLLALNNLRVSSIASGLFKTDWPGAPVSPHRETKSEPAKDLKAQDDLLDRGIEAARRLKAFRLRCFDFWRLDDQKPFRSDIDEKLRETAVTAGKHSVTLVLENEMSCNTGTGAESARVLKAIDLPAFKLNWDPGNAVFLGETAFPEGFNLIPRGRIGNVHIKDVTRDAAGHYEWASVGGGVIDFTGQFRALMRAGYRGPVSLETHWKGGGTPEESTRRSMKGLREALIRAGALRG